MELSVKVHNFLLIFMSNKFFSFKHLMSQRCIKTTNKIIPHESKQPKRICLTFKHKRQQTEQISEERSCWMKNPPEKLNYRALELEINLLYRYLRPTKEERSIRLKSIQKLRRILKNITTSLAVFGSTSTELYLLNSDVDIVLLEEDNITKSKQTKQLEKIWKRLRMYYDDIVFVRRAKVPIIKFKDSEMGFHFDISVNSRQASVAASEKCNEYLKLYPDKLPQLVFILKLFLKNRGLSEVRNGGVGGYGLVLWIVTFLRIRPSIYGSFAFPNDNMQDHDHSVAGTFLDFLHFFGFIFDYNEVGLAPQGLPSKPDIFMFYKRDYMMYNKKMSTRLAIMDPLNPQNNVTGGSKLITTISSSFANAYITLFNLLEQGNFKDKGFLASILNTQTVRDSDAKNDILTSTVHRKRRADTVKQSRNKKRKHQ